MDEIARNKHPEQTVEHILAASAKLFTQKGYEKTTIQDILDELKLSKGAIYHHFKSKEDILAVVIEHWNQQENALINELAMRVQGASGKEKIQNLIMDYLAGLRELYDPEPEASIWLLPKGHQFVMTAVTSLVQDVAPVFAKLIAEGVADGSLQTDYPLETAEITMLLFSLWTKPTVFGRNEQQTQRRLEALKHMLRQLGVEVLTDAMIEKMMAEYRHMRFFNEAKS